MAIDEEPCHSASTEEVARRLRGPVASCVALTMCVSLYSYNYAYNTYLIGFEFPSNCDKISIVFVAFMPMAMRHTMPTICPLREVSPRVRVCVRERERERELFLHAKQICFNTGTQIPESSNIVLHPHSFVPFRQIKMLIARS
jgi:hypothetical protein